MPIQIRDKQYTMVSERLQMVHQSGKSFEILASEPLQCGERWVWRVTVKIDGLEYRGSAEVHLNAKPGSADATDAFACAETSAVGRALGMANFGAIESIASADEIVRTEPSPSRHNGRQDGMMLGQPNDLADKLKAVTERARAQGIDSNERWASMLRYLEIPKIKSEAEIALIEAYLTQEAEKREKTTF